MPKTIPTDVLVNGDDFEFATVDYNSKSKIGELKSLIDEQDAVIRRKDIDWAKLSSVIIRL